MSFEDYFYGYDLDDLDNSEDDLYNNEDYLYNNEDDLYNNEDDLYNNEDDLYNNEEDFYDTDEEFHNASDYVDHGNYYHCISNAQNTIGPKIINSNGKKAQNILVKREEKIKEETKEKFIKIQNKSEKAKSELCHLPLDSKLSTSLWNFNCKKCDQNICKSTDIRLAENIYHIVINTKCFSSMIAVFDNPDSCQIKCSKCSSILGTQRTYKKRLFPTLKIDAFKLMSEEDSSSSRSFHKWKNVPFQIAAITQTEWSNFSEIHSLSYGFSAMKPEGANELTTDLVTASTLSALTISKSKISISTPLMAKSSTSSLWNFNCKCCDQYICKSTDIRVANNIHYIIINTECFSCMKTEIIQQNSCQIKCNKCNYILGNRQSYLGCLFPIIKIQAFRLTCETMATPPQSFKKWKDVPFQIAAVTSEELSSYNRNHSLSD